ncbi:DNA/RNA non-specific endonuclease [Ligilactobacillus murinus]|uniref:DNA/RNA non-specific endonuclease n=1 Tax=Ligilactobacillus murinus TaxID=1622 RepID=UPI0035186A49
MKQGKLIFLLITIVVIILAQPNVFRTVKRVLLPRSLSEQITKDTVSKSDREINKNLAKAKFDGRQVIEVNGNLPTLKPQKGDIKDKAEFYSDIDLLGRVGKTEVLLGIDTLSSNKKREISKLKPTGWKEKTVEINGKEQNFYRRCFLISPELGGKENEKNIFTGTRVLEENIADHSQSMSYYENLVKKYINDTRHRVLYQVTPIFHGINLVPKGVRMQAKSVEDDQLSFDVFVFNVQPGYKINYLNGNFEREQ